MTVDDDAAYVDGFATRYLLQCSGPLCARGISCDSGRVLSTRAHWGSVAGGLRRKAQLGRCVSVAATVQKRQDCFLDSTNRE